MTRLHGDWFRAVSLQTVLSVIETGGHRALMVGGCVRNDLIGRPLGDIDIATDAPPLRVTELAARTGLRVVPTGIGHGTVTVIADGSAYEVTTFRDDVETDGRRAVVAFSDDLVSDARRRDFTMNALYADRAGTVIDPLDGIGDLLARHVRFVGDPAARIAEDYLRILRFFRLNAWYGDPEHGVDPAGLAACATLSAGIDTLSRERVGAEMTKLLAAHDPAPAMAAMQRSGVLMRVLPGADAVAMAVLVHIEAGLDPDPIRRLAVLGGTGVTEALRLSRVAAARLDRIRTAAMGGATAAELGYRFGESDGTDAVLIRAALVGTSLPDGWSTECARGAAARFPVAAADLMPALQGAALGARLTDLEARWVASDFRLSREQLLA